MSRPVTVSTITPSVNSEAGDKSLLAQAALKSDCWKDFNVKVSNLEICQASRDLGVSVPISVVSELASDNKCLVTVLDGNSERRINPEQVLVSGSEGRSHLFFDNSTQRWARGRRLRLGIPAARAGMAWDCSGARGGEACVRHLGCIRLNNLPAPAGSAERERARIRAFAQAGLAYARAQEDHTAEEGRERRETAEEGRERREREEEGGEACEGEEEDTGCCFPFSLVYRMFN